VNLDQVPYKGADWLDVNPIIGGDAVDLRFERNEDVFYLDWHTQIDNPVTTLRHAIEHLNWSNMERCDKTEPLSVLHKALVSVFDEWFSPCE
jgi:hypothetical protein